MFVFFFRRPSFADDGVADNEDVATADDDDDEAYVVLKCETR